MIPDIDPLYIILGMSFAAVGVIVYVRAKHEQRIKKAVVTPKAKPLEPPPILGLDQAVVKDKAARIQDLTKLRDSGHISQVDYDTAKTKILFE